MKFKFLDHRADVKFMATGETLEECFISSAYALKETISKDRVKPRIERSILVKAKNKENLLHDFLEEFVFLKDSPGLVLSKIKNIKITAVKNSKGFFDLELECKMQMDWIKNYRSENDVKAVTFHELTIAQEKINRKMVFVARVIVDV